MVMEVKSGVYHGSATRGASLDEPTLLAQAASELNAPLVLLRQLGLALAADTMTPSERKRLSEQLTLTSERALRLTKQLTFSSDAPSLIELEPVNAVTLCQEVVHELSPLFMAHGRAITVHPRSKVPLLVANRQLLRQLLMGLGDNALHYASDDKPVQLIIKMLGGSVRIGVRDYGPAVPNDLWQQLDGRVARRAAVSLPRRPQVSGLGLMAARRLAAAMGGVVGVTRHRDGATFYVDMHQSGQLSLL